MTPPQFIAKWQAANLSERSAAQQHFLDLCDLVGHPKPAAADPDGSEYTFERGCRKMTGGNGWADVWKRGHFAWEYKGKHKNLDEAYRQLQLYRDDLENPPLLVVCDLDRFAIHTNFTGTAKQVFRFSLEDLAKPANLGILRRVFTDPESLRPGQTTESVTKQAAERFGLLADGLRVRGIPAPEAAHFLMKLMFCMFAEDIKLLPEDLFTKLLASSKGNPAKLAQRMRALFAAMEKGGDFGSDLISHFNGGLFADSDVIELRPTEAQVLSELCELDWSSIEPSIFGTLFERTLDPAKRSQIGAHYTSREDIETLLEPVVMTPLRREWAETREKCDKLWEKIKGKGPSRTARGKASAESKERRQHDRLIQSFLEHLAHVTILDPACGSGNFLYVAIHLLLDLEKEVIAYAATRGMSLLPHVRPTQLSGMEINEFAQQLAQVVIWIGYLQWMHDNGFNPPSDPVLEPIESIRRMDAILDLSDPEHPKEPQWPKADYIVGNPPFLGGKKMRAELGDPYMDTLYQVWHDRLSRDSDLCCFWFEKARDQIARHKTQRAGLLATQGIRGGENRGVLERIKETGNIFFAISDRDWILDGANVHISIIGFDDGSEGQRTLDGHSVSSIHTNLSSATDTTQACPLKENGGLYLRAPEKGGKFELYEDKALAMLPAPNPNGRPNSDVVRPWINGETLIKIRQSLWIIDFPAELTAAEVAQYELPYQYLEENVRRFRATNRYENLRNQWWRYRRPGQGGGCPLVS